jgi:hypothetical protein
MKKSGPSRELLATAEMAEDIGDACIENATRMLSTRELNLKSDHKVTKHRGETKESRFAKTVFHTASFKALKHVKH